jgi:hypothetical protein
VRTLVVLVSALITISGCGKSKPKDQEAPSNAENLGSGPPPTPPVATRTRIQLPAPTNKPPIKTTAVLDQAQMDKVGEPNFNGWDKIPHGGKDGKVEVRHSTTDHPKLMVIVKVDPCKDACTPIDLAKWQDATKQDALKLSLLGQGLVAAPDTVWDLGQTQLNNTPMIYAYALGQALHNGGSFTNVYALYYNDGVNQLNVIAQWADDPMRTKEMMAKSVPRELLEKVAKSFMDFYGQIW